MSLKIAFITLGCKVNSYETDALRALADKAGWEITDASLRADVYVINTCSVTNIADRKSRQMLHRVRELNPGAVIVATGCYAQIGQDKLVKSLDADIVLGNNHKSELVDAVNGFIATKGSSQSAQTVIADDIAKEKRFEPMTIEDCDERARAFIKIEDGCNQFCTYCIIPYARGRVRSRDAEDVLNEVRGLASAGYKEVVLTGIHLSSYGKADYEKQEGFDYAPLLDLIKRTAAIPGIERIRLGSLEPRIISTEFASELAAIPEFCPHFHLSLQSGSRSVLKRMNRHYSPEEFLDKCAILRKAFDRPFIATDVIAGFPGETEEEFAEGMEFLEKVHFSKMHIFKYSRRQGTAADRMPGQLTDRVKHERSEKLMELDRRMRAEYLEGFVSTEQNVLVEEIKCIDAVRYLVGRNERYEEIFTKLPDTEASAEEKYVNKIVRVKIISLFDDESLSAELVM